MPMLDPTFLDLRALGWGDLLATGMEERQLRSAMARDLIKLGVKRNNRMFFSLREYFIADLIRLLDAAWVPIGIATHVAPMVATDLEKIIEAYLKNGGGKSPAGSIKLDVAKGGDGIGLGYTDTFKALPEGTCIPVAKFSALPSMVTVSLDLLVGRLLQFVESVNDDADDRREGEE